MKRSDQDRLLREILEEGEAADFRAASLACGLAALQQRQRRRRVAQVCGTFVLTGLLIFALVYSQHAKISRTALVIPPASSGSPEASKVEIITDEQLFALFPNRPMALIGSPGHQQLVFLDHGRASEQP